jgi:hypothetical protein
MRRYHFHVFDGQTYSFDSIGMMLADLAAVVAEAESRARLVVRTHPHVPAWTKWKIDVRGEDDITIFHYPFEELKTTKAMSRPNKRIRASRQSGVV